MKKPTTVRGWLKMLLTIADSATGDLKGSCLLTDEQRYEITRLTAEIQNSLGEELADTLEIFNLNWNG